MHTFCFNLAVNKTHGNYDFSHVKKGRGTLIFVYIHVYVLNVYNFNNMKVYIHVHSATISLNPIV